MRFNVAIPVVAALLIGVVPSGLPHHATHVAVSAPRVDRLTTGAELVRLANVYAGTDTALADQGTGGSAGNMSPAATAPFGMLSWGPRTVPDAIAFGAGYTYSDKVISGFDLTRFQGGGCSGFQDVPITPTTELVTKSPASLLSGALDPKLSSTFDHAHESAAPGRYSVELNPGTSKAIGVDLAAATRSGVGSFDFPATGTGTVVINAGGSADAVDVAGVRILPASRTVEVTVANGRFCENPLGAKLHVVMRFDRPFASHATWQDESFHEGGTAAKSHAILGIGYTPGLGGLPPTLPGNPSGTAQAGAVLRFATAGHRTVNLRVGLSYVSMRGARAALRHEIGNSSVGVVQRRTASRWARLLGRMRVAGGTSIDRKMLATTLYQSLLSPQVLSDIDGSFPGLDGRIHRARTRTTYTQMSLWDEYRTHAQLLALLAPRQARDMARTLRQDFILAATAKGMSVPNLLFRQALRPSSLSLATLAGLNTARLLGSVVVVETLFGIPGIGRLLVESINNSDLVTVQGVVCVIAIAYVAVNLLTDLAYAIIDPRVRHGR